MSEKLDYRITKLETRLYFNYVEKSRFEEFYFKLKELCRDFHVEWSCVTCIKDVLEYELKE